MKIVVNASDNTQRNCCFYGSKNQSWLE